MTAHKQIRLTPAQVAALKPCSDRTRVFGVHKRMTARQAIEAGVPVADLLWVAGRLGRKDICVRFALECAQRVAHLNSDPRIQAAIDAAAAWVEDPSEENRLAAAAAAAAARWSAAAAAAAAAARRSAAAAAARWSAAEREAQTAVFLRIVETGQ